MGPGTCGGSLKGLIAFTLALKIVAPRRQTESLLVRGTVTVNSNARLSAATEETHCSQTAIPLQSTDDDGAAPFLPNVAQHPNQNIIYKASGIRLPTIELPKFSDDTVEWLSFRDTFESLISKNENIDPIQKFHYLKAALEGGAAQIIKSLEFTAVNYAVAWDTICDRFNNKRLLTHNHIKAIFNIKPLKEEFSGQIRETVDTLNKHLRALNVLDQATEHWDALLIYLLATKLDNISARVWEKERAENDVPTLKDFKAFLNSRANLLEALEQKDNSDQKLKQTERSKISTPQKRSNYVKGAKLCLNCMRPEHYLKDCKAAACKQCSGKHNTLLHFNKPSTGQAAATEEAKSSSTLCAYDKCDSHNVLLAIALVLVTDSQDKRHNVRAILDSGSQSSLMTGGLCQGLRLQTSKIHMTVEAVNGLSSKIEHKCKVELSTHYNSYKFDLQCIVIPEITGYLPAQHIDIQSSQLPFNIELADPSFHVSGRVDIFIGADWFWNLLCVGQLTIGQNQLTLQKTRLGWIAVGPSKGFYTKIIRCNLSRAGDIDEELTKFWEIEEFGNNKILSNEEKECKDHFVSTVRHDQNGRFVVNIPFKRNPRELGESRAIASKRLISLERRLQRNPILKKQYTFLAEYEKLGHMQKIAEGTAHKISYYLPHHCVVKADSSTTKVRMVFDASSATDNGILLNDLQLVGPTVQEDLFSILIRFRIHPYIISADIEKMYKQVLVTPEQVLVTPEQRSLQRIIWRSNDKDPISTFEFNTLTYGTASAPFLATRCLVELANEVKNQLPKIAEIIRKDFYVDDLLTGARTIEEATDVRRKISHVLKTASFKLRKWTSNEPAIVQDVPVKDQNRNSIDFKSEGQLKTLGTTWQAFSDKLTFTIRELNQTKITKRQVLTETAQIFDPLGLLSPCIIIAKILLQELWLHRLAWE
ncbi:uncharacterized protein LOC115233245 [Formica exsecta]|uniref:uncharacterized protein LOC115233245 n=1 Tax=Formica exsecta TaxID=72781 RepID=UPI001141AF69|nr:uncharacterized protein LOC115233245 [Formica exsecta]